MNGSYLNKLERNSHKTGIEKTYASNVSLMYVHYAFQILVGVPNMDIQICCYKNKYLLVTNKAYGIQAVCALMNMVAIQRNIPLCDTMRKIHVSFSVALRNYHENIPHFPLICRVHSFAYFMHYTYTRCIGTRLQRASKYSCTVNISSLYLPMQRSPNLVATGFGAFRF